MTVTGVWKVTALMSEEEDPALPGLSALSGTTSTAAPATGL